MYQDHVCQALNPDEIKVTVFNYEIQKKEEQSHDPPRLINHQSRPMLSLDAAIIVP